MNAQAYVRFRVYDFLLLSTITMAHIRVLYTFANGRVYKATFINNNYCQTRVPKGLRPHAGAEVFVFIINLQHYIIII